MLRVALCVLLSGCGGLPQAEECARYVECQQARDAAMGITRDMVRYEVDGGCWVNEGTAFICSNSCVAGLDWMRDAYADLPSACAP